VGKEKKRRKKEDKEEREKEQEEKKRIRGRIMRLGKISMRRRKRWSRKSRRGGIRM
jgi:hypothetical protein